MKRTATILRYIGIAGFTLVVIAYMLHGLNKHHAIILIAVSLLASSISTIIRTSANNIEANKLLKKPRKKVINRVVYFFGFLAIFGLILVIMHIRHTGTLIVSFSLAGMICTCIVMLCSRSVRSGITALYPAYSLLHFIIQFSLVLSFISICIGLILKINHYTGGNMFMYTGTGLILIGLLPIVVYVRILRNRYMQKYPRVYSDTGALIPGEQSRYAGTYYNAQLKINITIIVQDTGTALVMDQVDGYLPYLLKAIKRDTFTNDRICVAIEFNEQGEFVLKQHEKEFRFIKNDG